MSVYKRYGMKHSAIWMILLCMTVALILCAPSVLPAAQNNGDMTIQSINPVPKLDQPERSDPQIIANDQGTIQRIARDEIVINDCLHKFSTPNLAAGFNVGDDVRFIKNDAGAIIRLKKIKKPAK